MKDGLYRVETPYLCAGFIVEDGKITRCAPILRKNINRWKSVVKDIDNLPELWENGQMVRQSGR